MFEKPTLPHLFEALAAILVVAILYFQWQEGRQQALQFAETMKEQQALYAQAQAQTVQLQADIASRDRAAQTQIEALKSQVAHLQTPTQISPWLADTINKQLQSKGDTTPIVIQAPSAGSTAPVEASIPQSDMQAIRDLVSQAQQDSVNLKACTSDKASLQSEVTAKNAEVAEVTKEKNAAVQMAKGGSKLHRLVTVFKYVGIGLGVGLVIGAKKF